MHFGAVAAGKSGEHDRVAIDDAVAVWLRANWQQLITGDQDANARPPDDADLRESERSEQAHVLRAQHAAVCQHGLTRRNVLAAAADMTLRRDGFRDAQSRVVLLAHFSLQYGVGAHGQRRTGHDAYGL